MPELTNERHERFCREYIADLNATAAYIRSGYSARGAKTAASRLLSNVNVRKRIAELRAEVAERLEVTTDSIVRRYADIVSADPNELVSARRGACRFCHGIEHNYQWRTVGEYERALAVWGSLPEKKRDLIQPPTNEGGFGYTFRAEPHPSCPECDGDGEAKIMLGDTSKVSPKARLLYAGLKQTAGGGLEVKMKDQMHALDQLARHLGVFENDNRNPAMTDLAAAILQINSRGSAAPIGSDD